MRVLCSLVVLLLVAAGCDSGPNTPGPPVTAEILKITVDDAPLSDPAGEGWDGNNPLSDGPEIYFRLFDDDVDYQSDPGGDRLNARDDDDIVFPIGGTGQAWFEDVRVVDFPLVWEVDPGYVVRDLDDPLYLALFDYDPNPDDPMAESYTFALRDYAPDVETGRAQTFSLEGFDRNGNAIADFDVRITVQFFD